MRSVAAFIKRGISFFPHNRDARDMFANIAEGAVVFIEVWSPRNMKQHRAYFAMLNNVVEASALWKSREALEYELALALNRGSFIELRNGKRRFEPDSRAVASMKKEDFERLHSDTVKLLTEWLGCDPEMLREEAA